MMDRHRPAVWISDRYTAQHGHAAAYQTCLTHLARDVAYVAETSDDPVPWCLQLWLASVFALTEHVTDLAASTLAAKRWSLDRQLGVILATPSRCDLTLDLQAKIGQDRHQLLVFPAHPGAVKPTNKGSERLLRSSVVQRKVTNGYRAMWAAEGEATIRTVVDTARLAGRSPFSTILTTVGA
jgi:transposase